MAEAGRTTAFEHAELAANWTKPGERRFASVEALIEQMQRDVEEVRRRV